MSFLPVQIALQENFDKLSKDHTMLFVTNTDKDAMWETYLSSFPEEERQGYNCNCCRSFIKHFGNVVVIEDNVVKTIWNLSYSDPKLSKVFKAMDKLVKASPVAEVYVNSFPKIGTPSNVQLLEDKTTTKWYHLFLKVPGRLILSRSSDVDAGMRGEFRSTKEVFKRSLDEITLDAVDTVLELIAQNSIYRGNEFQFMIETFKSYQALYKNLKPEVQDNYAWSRFTAAGSCAKIRNTAIGTLLVDISNGEDVEKSVMSFERIMAPANYKRPTAIITKRQVEDAEKYLAEHGMTDSLGRRLATEYDVSVSNVLFTNRDKKSVTSLLGDLKETIPVNPKTFNKVEEIPVKDFLEKVLPSATKLEVLFEQSHMPNLVSLIAPKEPKAPSLFKWDNPFSWSYKEGTADSIKERVKQAGGRVEGELRVSLSWFNLDDLDLHVLQPNGIVIYFSNKADLATRGQLDVDMNAGSGTTRTPVENIIWPSSAPMREGKYIVKVHNFAKRETIDGGFIVEVECKGESWNFNVDKSPANQAFVSVIEFNYSKKDGISMLATNGTSSKVASKEVWGLGTNKFQEVSMVMKSPSHWSTPVGNEHLFFMIRGAKVDGNPRGFFNEFLKEDLLKNKRVFEALGSRTKVDTEVEKQLSGLGFSSTQRNELLCKVTGKTERILKIKF